MNNNNNMAIEPEPHDIIPGERYWKDSITLLNNTRRTIAIGQLGSSWESANFIIDAKERPDKKVRWLATLYPKDTIKLTFNPPDEIKP